MHQEKEWFDETCQLPSTLNIQRPSSDAIQQFRDILLNQPPLAIACQSISTHQFSKLAFTRWLTDDLLDSVSRLVNNSSNDCMSLVLSEYNKRCMTNYVSTALNGRSSIRLLFFIVNVSIDPLSGTAFASNKILGGNHWTVLVTDVSTNLSYYGDSLGYPVPPTSFWNVSRHSLNCKKYWESRLQYLKASSKHQSTFDKNGKHACSRECCNYPVQTDSSSCGVIAFMFVATVSFGPHEVWPYVRLPQIQCHPL